MALSIRAKSRRILQNQVTPSEKLIRLPEASALVGRDRVVHAESHASSDLRDGRYVKLSGPLGTSTLVDLARDHAASQSDQTLELVEQVASNV